MQNKYISEEAYYNSMNKNPVYVVLMNGGTPLSKIISGFTGDTYTHACISFNAKLKPLYSFGLTNDSAFGFAVANPRDKKAFPHIDKYAVYVMYVSNHQLYKMKKRLKWFIDNGKDLKFDFPALVSVFFQKDTENHSDKYFCSRFVAEILKMGEVDLEKKASLYRPESLLALSNISLVNWGRDIIGYNWIKTRDNERLIKQNRYAHPTSLIPKFESKSIKGPSKWYHLVPKGTNLNEGIISPWYMMNTNKEDLLSDVLDKYRDRLVSDDFNIYPGRDPESLTTEEILSGLDKIRGKYGSKCIYMFKYPPYFGMGRNMNKILLGKDLYEIDLNKVDDIEYIDYGRMFSHGDGEPLTKEYYDTISPEEYFSNYDDNIPMLFSRLNHIAVSTNSGFIPKKAIRKIQIPKRMDNKGPYQQNISISESTLIIEENFDAILEDSFDIRVSKAARYKNNTRLLIASKEKLGDVLKPKSYKVKGKQENFCILTRSIDHALMMLGEFCLGKEYFVYQTEDIYDLYNPKDDERIYPKCVSEVWIKSPVKISYMKKIKVTRDMFYPKYRNNPPEDIGSINNPYTWNTIETGVQHDSTWIKESVLTESKSNNQIYFISDKNMDGKVLSPRIPDNYFTRHGYEDTKIKRVCFTPSIDKSLMALSNNITGKEFYVHIAIGDYKVYKPTVKQVPDSKVTGELWVTKPVKVSCIGKIKVIGDMGLPGHKFSYGDKEAELYDWKYEWVERLNSMVESCNTLDIYITESNQKSTVLLDFKKKSGIKFAFIDIHDSRAKKYLDKNSFYKKNFKKIMSITNGEIAVDVDNDKLAGYIYVGAGKKGQDKNYGFIQTLEVLKQYRGYGLSNNLLDDAIKKYNAVDLTVYKDNEVALKLYKKHGFVIIGYGNSKDKSDYWMKLKTKLTKDDNIMNEAVITEACKNIREARRFVQDVEKLAKKYNANYFLVTDGASGTNNKDNKAVKYCRDALKEWERKNKFNPDEDWSKNPDDFSDYKLEETMLYEFANKELLDKIHVTSDVELSKWMKSNIKYQEFKTLMTPEEVFESRMGSCHDQVVFELAVLKALKYSPKALFFIEYNEGDNVGGQTHSFVYYRRGTKFYWFENAWGGQAGIHGPYKNVKELKNDIISKHDTKKYKKLQFASFKGKEGMSLDELVKACLK